MSEVALQYLVTSATDGPFGSSLTSAHYTDEGVRVIRLGNIGDGRWKDDDKAYIAQDHAQALARHEARSGDVVVAGLGDETNHLGRAAVVPGLERAIVKADCFRLRLRPTVVDPRFFVYAMSGVGTREARRRAHGSTRQRLPLNEMLRVPIPLPSMQRQRRAVNYLDAQTERMDALIKMNERSERLVRERLDAVLAMSVGTDVIERSDGVPVGLRDMTNAPLYTLAEVQSGLTLNAASTDATAPLWPYLRVANVQDGRLDLRALKTVHVPTEIAHRHLLRPGDVLMTEGGDPDKLGRGTVFRGEVEGCLHQNHVFAVRPDQRLLSPSYLALVTRTPYARAYFEKTSTKSTGIASTNASKIGAWRVPLPPREVQDQIVARTDAAAALTDEVCQRLLDQRTLLQERRQALITAAVTGQIEV
jgi:type I restriction enzyme, S subunit